MTSSSRLLIGVGILVMSLLANAQVPVSWITSTVKPLGGRHSYSATTGKVAYDLIEGDGYLDVHTINLDGTGDVCLTCGLVTPNKHIGEPRLSPAGNWLLFLAQQTDASCTDTEAHAGNGYCNSLKIWKMADGSVTTLVAATAKGGVAEKLAWPQWSADQTTIMWTQYNNTVASVKTAPLDLSGTPTLGPINSYQPATAQGFYETWGWLDANKKKILLACLCEPGDDAADLDLAIFDTQTSVFTRLTNTNEITEEHASASPYAGADTILYTSNGGGSLLAWDLYTMREDGSQKTRITSFNDPLHAQYAKFVLTMANPEWVTATSYLVHGVYDWTYPYSGNVVLMGLGVVPTGRSSGAGSRLSRP